MTLLVRDERDIVEQHLAFHLAAGVDVVIVTDHASTDGTRGGARATTSATGVVRVLREPDGPFRQREWVTRMARLAATEHGADWVINGDADEFWWPRGGSLPEVLAAIPRRYGIVQSFVRHFVPVRRRRAAVPGADDATGSPARRRSTTLRARGGRTARSSTARRRRSSSSRAATPSARTSSSRCAAGTRSSASTSRSARRPRSSGRDAPGATRSRSSTPRRTSPRAPGTAYHALQHEAAARGRRRRVLRRARRRGRTTSRRARGRAPRRGHPRPRRAARSLARRRARSRFPRPTTLDDAVVRGRRGRARRGGRRSGPSAGSTTSSGGVGRARAPARPCGASARGPRAVLRRDRDEGRPHARSSATRPTSSRRTSRYHLALGVDLVIVTDHRSIDGTTEILARATSATAGLTLIREESRGAPAVGVGDPHGAPRGDRARRRLGDQRRRGRVLVAARRRRSARSSPPCRRGSGRSAASGGNFVPRPDDGAPFLERMTVRRRPVADLTDPYHAQVKVVHRARPGRRRDAGEPRRARSRRCRSIREWLPVRGPALPAPQRRAGAAQVPVARDAGLASPGTSVPQHTEAAVRTMDAEGDRRSTAALVVDDAAVERGLASGELTEDTRLRDALRALARGTSAARGAGADARRRRRPSPSRRRRCSSTTAG